MGHTYQLCEYLFQMLRGEQASVKQQVPTLFHTLASQDQQLMGRIVGQHSPHLQIVTRKHQRFSSNSSFLCATYSKSSEDEMKIPSCNKWLQKKEAGFVPSPQNEPAPEMDRSAPERQKLWCCDADTCALKRQKERQGKKKNRIERGGQDRQAVSQEEGNKTWL